MKNVIIVLLGLVISIGNVYAQNNGSDYPKVDEKISDYIFNDVQNYPENKFEINSFRGKWLVLDFWAPSCGACIASFPKMNKLAHQFNDKVQLLMVGLYKNGKNNNGQSKESIIKNLFYYHKIKHQLDFSAAFDSLVDVVFDIFAVPAVFVVNPDGILVSKTTSLDSVALSDLIAGKTSFLEYSYSKHEKLSNSEYYNANFPLLTKGGESNGGIDTAFIYRSLLTKWNEKMPSWLLYGWNDSVNEYKNNAFKAEAVGFDLPGLIFIAYTGVDRWYSTDSLYDTMSHQLVLEVKNKQLFVRRGNRRTSENSYAYSLSVPVNQANIIKIRRMLLEDLQRCFGFRSVIEIRKTPVYRIIVIDPEKVLALKSKGGKTTYKSNIDIPGFKLINFPFKRFIKETGIQTGLYNSFKDDSGEVPPIIDATGIDFNIDLVFDGDVIDLETTLDNLHKYGLDLIKGEVDMRCIVVRDAE